MKLRLISGILILIAVLFFQNIGTHAISMNTIIFHSSVKKGATFQWKIETIRTSRNQTSWEWKWANFVTLTQGDYISIEWLANPNDTTEIDVRGPIRYDVLTKVGSRTLNFSNQETFFNFLIAPIYTISEFGKIESGFNALERLWFRSYKLPNAYIPTDYGEYIWNFDMQNATLQNTGENASKGTIVLGHVISQKFYETETQAIHVFDVAYDPITGFVKRMKFPATGVYGYPVANSTHDITEGLNELLISSVDHKTASGYEVPVILSGFFAIISLRTIVHIRKKKKI